MCRIAFLPFLLLVSVLFPLRLAAQVILSDEALPQLRIRERPQLQLRNGLPDTLMISENAPFFDDFSQGGMVPDSQWWFLPPTLAASHPTLSRNLSIAPPTLGVATFDGLRPTNQPYESSTLTTGPADELFSHLIDLSGYSLPDNLMLSFALQPQGHGDAPEATDSFEVYFRTPLPPPDDFRRVFVVAGSGNQPFRQYTVELNDPIFFHSDFQLRFRSLGARFGALDHWHLDYVYLAPGRTAADTVFADASPTRLTPSPLRPYSAVPAAYYRSGAASQQTFQVEIGHLFDQTTNAELQVDLLDPVGNNSLTVPPFSQSQNLSLTPAAQGSATFSPFADQLITQPGIFEYRAIVAANGDSNPSNDTLRVRMRVDSLIAYDDGEADGAIGLNQPWGFGSEFELGRPDSLTAVWICFVPTVNFNTINQQTTYMEDASFRLAIWKDPHPDSLLLQQIGGSRVTYGEQPNTFIRFPLSSPLAVPSRFWVGVQQTNGLPLGLGLDKTYDNGSLSYRDSNGVWALLDIAGTLMIRPEIAYAGVLADAPGRRAAPLVQLIGNGNPSLELRWEGRNLRRYEAQVFDLQGRLLRRMAWETPLAPLDLMPKVRELPPGLYLWSHQLHWENGEISQQREKWLKQP